MSTSNSTDVLTDVGWKVKLVNWVKTTRVQTAMVTALALWIGYVTVAPLDIQSAILLGVIGLLVHLWGFTLNEVEDYKYDAKMGDIEGHPIAQGKVHAGLARYFAWGSALVAVGISALTPYNIWATVVLLLSFIPGYMYDKWSKTHWWSNLYLSIWAALMVLAGGLYAGEPNTYTILLAIAVSIQIFVQVVQGDLKDFNGPEQTLAGRMGVSTKPLKGFNADSKVGGIVDKDDTDKLCEVMMYPRQFSWSIYLLKFTEAIILMYVSISVAMLVDTFPIMDSGTSAGYFALILMLGIAFITTVSMFMVYSYDREEIKKKSSLHELISIVFLGAAVAPLHVQSAVLIAILPILWYLVVNHIIHSSALNPDI